METASRRRSAVGDVVRCTCGIREESAVIRDLRFESSDGGVRQRHLLRQAVLHRGDAVLIRRDLSIVGRDLLLINVDGVLNGSAGGIVEAVQSVDRRTQESRS